MGITLAFSSATIVIRFQQEPLSVRVINARGGENLRISTETAVHLGNGTR